jgi:hypothetical protein
VEKSAELAEIQAQGLDGERGREMTEEQMLYHFNEIDQKLNAMQLTIEYLARVAERMLGMLTPRSREMLEGDL